MKGLDIRPGFNFMENFPVLHDLGRRRKLSAHDRKGGNDRDAEK